jgi:hypothetical protein
MKILPAAGRTPRPRKKLPETMKPLAVEAAPRKTAGRLISSENANRSEKPASLSRKAR